MSEGNTCTAKSNLEVSKGLVQFLLVKSIFFEKMMYYQMTKNSAVNRNLTRVTNNSNYSSKCL